MTSKNRREFLRTVAGTAGAASALSVLPAGIRNALALPANNEKKSIEDIEHIVILMQENRSFDHYFGTLRGVRGFGDTRTTPLPNGKPVFYQPNGTGYLLPFRPSAPNLGMQFIQDLAHDWTSTHGAWNNGHYDQWVPTKGTTTMAYFTREDIPFHYALADAFTICDAYHCSTLTSTDPNRYYMWTGWVGNDGSGGGPVIDNAEAGYAWSTYPELLERAGVPWKIYQDVGIGLTAAGAWGWTSDAYIGNFGDNSLLYFKQYQTSQPGSSLYEKALTGTNVSVSGDYFDILKADVENDNLPAVSWIVAPEAFSEHPNWPANYGAWYVNQVLEVLTSNAKLWSKTALIITFDENDGFFDHVSPPFASSTSATGQSTVATTHEFFEGNSTYPAGPYGLGPRVPMLIVSPWTKGGYVCSEVFDHTSIIRFIDKRFGKQYGIQAERNITPWRRAICGDLMSAFNFDNPNDVVPPMPDTTAFAPPDKLRHPDFVPVPPTTQALPQQESGVRPARALPYEFFVHGKMDPSNGKFELAFSNTGDAGATFLVYANDGAATPMSYTVEAGKKLTDPLLVEAGSDGDYAFAVFGPNGFLREFRGSAAKLGKHGSANPEIANGYDVANGNVQIKLKNNGDSACVFTIANAYGSSVPRTYKVRPGDDVDVDWDLRSSYGWYDLSVTVDSDAKFKRRFAGHVETGRSSASDPALGA
ncbi:phosphocholine-specific phospholipase C [Pararobbsia alpina]|uniref:phospholipase C n=1 Tax=Pararobbsia alpina TaxID=621374 RepID=A0A6S7CIK6_9BURK|nr:phospholipase C, phosphocholine-specific [Pararobbsia alpina]CAB3790823.1 Non-hemolytic phospholipase C [Pararobbsia alpina]